MRLLITLLLLLGADSALGDGIRCGSRLVMTGDPVSRLVQACGKPDRSFQARVLVGEREQRREVGVTQWVYERRRRPDLIVSLRGGSVVRIDRG